MLICLRMHVWLNRVIWRNLTWRSPRSVPLTPFTSVHSAYLLRFRVHSCTEPSRPFRIVSLPHANDFGHGLVSMAAKLQTPPLVCPLCRSLSLHDVLQGTA